MGCSRKVRTQNVRALISSWIDTLDPGTEFYPQSLAVQYNRNAISIGNILKEWNGDRIKLSAKNRNTRLHGSIGSVWVKL